jgi:hypothetical protein
MRNSRKPRKPAPERANDPRRVVSDTYNRCQGLINAHGNLLSDKERNLLEVITRAFRMEVRVTKGELDAAFGVLGSFTPSARRNVPRHVNRSITP